MTVQAQSILELCADDVCQRVANLTKANGYSFDVAEVVRPRQSGGLSVGHLTAVITQGPPDPDQGNAPGNREQWIQPFDIEIIVSLPDDDTTSIDKFANVISADLMKALFRSSSAPSTVDYSLGGLATRLEIAGAENIERDGALGGVRLTLEVTYRHAIDDPYDDGA